MPVAPSITLRADTETKQKTCKKFKIMPIALYCEEPIFNSTCFVTRLYLENNYSSNVKSKHKKMNLKFIIYKKCNTG